MDNVRNLCCCFSAVFEFSFFNLQENIFLDIIIQLLGILHRIVTTVESNRVIYSVFTLKG